MYSSTVSKDTLEKKPQMKHEVCMSRIKGLLLELSNLDALIDKLESGISTTDSPTNTVEPLSLADFLSAVPDIIEEASASVVRSIGRIRTIVDVGGNSPSHHGKG